MSQTDKLGLLGRRIKVVVVAIRKNKERKDQLLRRIQSYRIQMAIVSIREIRSGSYTHMESMRTIEKVRKTHTSYTAEFY